MIVVDPNMNTALEWAKEIGSPPPLPKSLENVNQRAKLVDAVDATFARKPLLEELSNDEKVRRLDEMASISKSKKYIPEIDDDKTRKNIILRLWSGCLKAAKIIALETLSGKNTPEMRKRFSENIDAIAKKDRIFCAGVEAAPAFKRLRKQQYSFEGVPENSPVRKFEK